MKSLLKCQEMMAIHYATGNLLDFNLLDIIKIIINSLVRNYQDKQIRIFLNKLVLQENWKKIMVQKCFLSLKSSKKQFNIFLQIHCHRII